MSEIREFWVNGFDEYDFNQANVGSPVFLGHKYGLEDICGKVVYISTSRKVVNIEFYKHHPLNDIVKKMMPRLKLDLVYYETFSSPPKLVSDFVLYLDHGRV